MSKYAVDTNPGQTWWYVKTNMRDWCYNQDS